MVVFWASGGILGPSWCLQAVFATLGRLLVCLLGRSWVPCGGPGPLPVGVWGTSGWFLDVSWAARGPLLGDPACPLNLSWISFGGSRAAPGSQRRRFTTPCKTAIFQLFSTVFQAGESLRGASLGPLGRPWGRRGASWAVLGGFGWLLCCLLYTSPSPRDA